MKHNTLFWARTLFFTLALLIIVTQISPALAFGEPAHPVEIIENFWNCQNAHYDYINSNERYSRELESIIDRTAVFPNEFTHLISKPVYNYLWINKMPTTKAVGEAIIRARMSDGSTRHFKIMLKKLESKSLPPVKVNTYSQRTGDIIMGAKPHAEIKFQTYIGLQDWEYFYKHSVALNMLFYTENDFKEWECKVTHRESGQSKTLADPQKNLYTSRMDAAFQLEIKNSDTDIPYDANFETELFACMKNGEKIKLAHEAQKQILDPIVFAKKPVWVKIKHPREMFETEAFKVHDETVAASKKVYVDFVELSAEETEDFFAGEYFFPLAERDSVHSIEVVYTSADGTESSYCDHVITYTFKPVSNIAISGTTKENRACGAGVNVLLSDYARRVAQVKSTLTAQFSKLSSLKEFYDSTSQYTESEALRYRVKESDRLSFISVIPGKVDLSVNTIVSAPSEYVQREVPSGYFSNSPTQSDIVIRPDLPPAIILLPYSLSISRLDAFDYYSDAVSLDGDSIASCDIQLKKLLENGECETIEHSRGMKLALGRYRLELVATEKMEGETYAELLPENSKKVSKSGADFSVENYAPTTIISLDLKAKLPKADITIVTDDIEHSEIISQKKVAITNHLRELGIDAFINHHDKAVYTYSMKVYDSNNFGASYPSSTYHYSNNGYRGTLSLDRVSNNPYTVDRGSYKNVKKSHSIEEHVPNNSSRDAIFKWTKGRWIQTQAWNGRQLPSTRSYSCSHGRVTLNKTGSYFGHDSSSPTRDGLYEGEIWRIPYDFTAIYTGVCTYNDKVWEPKYVSVDSYTGHYSGTVRKSVVKPFAEQSRMYSDRLKVYFNTDETPNDDAGNMVAQCDYEEMLSLISEHLKTVIPPKNTVLVNDELKFVSEDSDLEFDEIFVKFIKLTHDPSIFQNPDENISGNIITIPTSFTKAGKYLLSREIADKPPIEQYSKSANACIEITAHRKPTADFEIDWTFANGKYDITLEDKSFDPDFEFDADKGIATKIYRYRKAGGDYVYEKPSQLSEGEYFVSLMVKDKFGAWSEESIKTIKLKAIPDVSLQAKLKYCSEHSSEAASGENVTVCEIQSKYHTDHDIFIQAFDKQTVIPFESAVSLGKDRYKWSDTEITIPEDTSDGIYNIRIHSNPAGEILLPVKVNTPIIVKGKTLQSEKLELSAITNKYAVSASATIFSGSKHERVIELALTENEGETKTWHAEVDIDEIDLQDGIYTTVFTAATASGKTATDSVTEEFVFLKIKNVAASGAHNLWNKSRFMGYEKIEITVELNKPADEVELRFSPELEAMNYRNSNGHNYSYREEFGYTVDFPIIMTNADSSRTIWTAKYILPIAESTIDWEGKTIKEPYKMYVKAIRNKKAAEADYPIDITGNIHDRMYVRPLIE